MFSGSVSRLLSSSYGPQEVVPARWSKAKERENRRSYSPVRRRSKSSEKVDHSEQEVLSRRRIRIHRHRMWFRWTVELETFAELVCKQEDGSDRDAGPVRSSADDAARRRSDVAGRESRLCQERSKNKPPYGSGSRRRHNEKSSSAEIFFDGGKRFFFIHC